MHKANDVRIEVKVRNNLILSRMEERGIRSVSELCRKLEETREADEPIAYQSRVGELINMKEPARKPDGEWIDLAIRLANFFQCMPEDIFSDPQQWQKLEKNRTHAEVTYTELQKLKARHQEPVTPELAMQANELRAALSTALSTLTPREERVLRLRFGFDGGDDKTLEEIAEILGGITRARIRDIEMIALRKLAHFSRSGKLAAVAGKLIATRDYKGKLITRSGLDSEILEAL